MSKIPKVVRGPDAWNLLAPMPGWVRKSSPLPVPYPRSSGQYEISKVLAQEPDPRINAWLQNALVRHAKDMGSERDVLRTLQDDLTARRYARHGRNNMNARQDAELGGDLPYIDWRSPQTMRYEDVGDQSILLIPKKSSHYVRGPETVNGVPEWMEPLDMEQRLGALSLWAANRSNLSEVNPVVLDALRSSNLMGSLGPGKEKLVAKERPGALADYYNSIRDVLDAKEANFGNTSPMRRAQWNKNLQDMSRHYMNMDEPWKVPTMPYTGGMFRLGLNTDVNPFYQTDPDAERTVRELLFTKYPELERTVRDDRIDVPNMQHLDINTMRHMNDVLRADLAEGRLRPQTLDRNQLSFAQAFERMRDSQLAELRAATRQKTIDAGKTKLQLANEWLSGQEPVYQHMNEEGAPAYRWFKMPTTEVKALQATPNGDPVEIGGKVRRAPTSADIKTAQNFGCLGNWCLGQEANARQYLSAGDHYAMVGPDGAPVVMIDARDVNAGPAHAQGRGKRIAQIQGTYNSVPRTELMPYVSEFIQNHLRPSDIGPSERSGLVAMPFDYGVHEGENIRYVTPEIRDRMNKWTDLDYTESLPHSLLEEENQVRKMLGLPEWNGE